MDDCSAIYEGDIFKRTLANIKLELLRRGHKETRGAE